MNNPMPTGDNAPPPPNWGPPVSRPAAQPTAMLVRPVERDPVETGVETESHRRQPGLEAWPRWTLIVAAAGLAALLIDLALRSRINSAASFAATVIITFLVLSSPIRRRPSVIAAATLSIAAVAMTMLRASNWVVFPALAVTVGGLVVASQDLLARPRWSVVWSNYALALTTAIRSASDLVLRRRAASAAKPLARAAVLAAVVVVPLGLLLASADAAFRGLLLGTADGQTWSHILLTAAIVPLVVALAVSARTTDKGGPWHQRNHRMLSMMEGAVVLGSVITLLTVWGITQVIVAIGGAERLLATANLTAAENARGGFFQLVAATAILIGVIIAADRLTDRTAASDRARFLGLTSVIAVETLGLVFATYSRLALYISGFGNTMLRLSVAWFLAWLAAVMVVVVVSINRKSPQTGQTGSIIFVLAGLWVIAFGLSNPEATVANTNLDRQQAVVGLDARYLGSALGPDATPLLVERLPSLDADTRQVLTADLCRRSALSNAEDQAADNYGWLSWNWSHATADAAVENLSC